MSNPQDVPVYAREAVLTKAELASALKTTKRTVEREDIAPSFYLGPRSPRWIWGHVLDMLTSRGRAA